MSKKNTPTVDRRAGALWMLGSLLLFFIVPSIAQGRPPTRANEEEVLMQGTGDPIGGEKAPPSIRKIRIIPQIIIDGDGSGGSVAVPSGTGGMTSTVSPGSRDERGRNLRTWLVWLYARLMGGRF